MLCRAVPAVTRDFMIQAFAYGSKMAAMRWLFTTLVPHAGSDADETKVKEETGATLRCIPFEQDSSNHTCFFTGQSATETVIFAKAH